MVSAGVSLCRLLFPQHHVGSTAHRAEGLVGGGVIFPRTHEVRPLADRAVPNWADDLPLSQIFN
jgi:hypothetical protein